jgi:hypothetical protein
METPQRGDRYYNVNFILFFKIREILSHVRGSVTNNCGYQICLTSLLQLQLILTSRALYPLTTNLSTAV